jgi:hypothetical protein
VVDNITESDYVTEHSDNDWTTPSIMPSSSNSGKVDDTKADGRSLKCRCDFIAFDCDKVKRILEGGGIPLISFRPPIQNDAVQEIQLDVVQAEEHTPYIAVSHVSNIVGCS